MKGPVPESRVLGVATVGSCFPHLRPAPSLSVVIPTYGREESLCETLKGVLQLSYADWELLIVDQTPEHKPETMAFLDTLPPPTRRIVLAAPSLPVARNVGAREARGEVVLYLDDDITPLPGLLVAHARHYRDPTVGGVAGRLVSPTGEVRPLDARYSRSPLPWLYIRFDQKWDCREVEAAPGGNMSFRRDLIRLVGGFDERFVGNAFREETDFCLRLRATSSRILFDPDAAVIHHFATDGGCDNNSLGRVDDPSVAYYRDFVRNNVYLFCKHVPSRLIPGLLWELYRTHVGNRPILRRGPRFFWRRQAGFLLGLMDGWRAWRSSRHPAPQSR
ncbi:MAG: glycosyltransferase family 2 protein [Candidatus Methylomirabilales bacterium]